MKLDFVIVPIRKKRTRFVVQRSEDVQKALSNVEAVAYVSAGSLCVMVDPIVVMPQMKTVHCQKQTIKLNVQILHSIVTKVINVFHERRYVMERRSVQMEKMKWDVILRDHESKLHALYFLLKIMF